MRRYISYLLLCAATLIGAGAATVPMIQSMDTDMAYSVGETLHFKAAEWDESSVNGNYTNESGTFLEYLDGFKKQPIEYIADTMRTRLDAYGLSGYKVETQGTDSIAVTVRTPKDADTHYSYLERYLSFSGGDYELDASNTRIDGYAYNELWATIIDGQTAYIADMEQGTYKVPTVIVPLKEGDDYKTAFNDLVKFCEDNTSEATDEDGSSAKSTSIVVWANRVDGDAYDLSGSNPNVANKIVSMVSAANGVYYADSDTDKENPSLRLIPNSSATSGEQYDPTKTQEAYDAARALMLTINAGAFQYDDLKGAAAVAPKYAVTFTYSEVAPATVENLVVNGDWNRELAMSATLISLGVTLLFLCVLLAVFERIMAVLHVSTMVISMFSAFSTFVAFGAPFNIAALIGLTAGGFVSLFGTLFYSAKLKEELYKGRTLKKAHSEAVRKSLWPTVDIGVVAILIGICVYGLAGDVASKAGVMLVLGGFFGLIASLLYTRIAGWLLCNDSTMASKFPKQLGVRSERIPDLAKEEKQSYFGPYADRDFSRGKKISLIASCLFLLAGIGASIGWGVVSGGTSFFNSSAYETDASVLHIDVRSDDPDTIKISSLSEVSSLIDPTFVEGQAPQDVFHTYKLNGKYLADYVSELNLSKVGHTSFVGEGETGDTYYWFYYEAKLGKSAQEFTSWIKNIDVSLSLEKWNGSAYVAMPESSFSELSADIIAEVGGSVRGELATGAYAEDIYITFDTVVPADLTPYLWQVALGLGVGIATVLVYLCIRFRPSRGLVAGGFIAASSFIAVTFFILTRIGSSPVVSIGAIPVALLAAALALYLLNAEKEIYRECKDRDKDNPEFRALCLNQAASRQAGNVLLLTLLGLYVAVVFLAFGPRIYANAYLAIVLGIAFATALILTALPPCAALLGKQFAKITIRRDPSKAAKKRKAKTGGQLMKKKKSAEPEESIFIGIND